MLHRERRAATARGGGIWVFNYKLSAVNVFFVIYFCANQVLVAHGVDKQRYAVFVQWRVVFVHVFIESEAVLKPEQPPP